MYSQGSKKAGFCYSTNLPLFLLAFALLLSVIGENTLLCQNSFPVIAPFGTGIGPSLRSINKPLHLYTYPNYDWGGAIKNDPAFRISFGDDYNTNESSYGHLVLITPQNNLDFYYTNIGNCNPDHYGDFVLQASPKAEDLILTTRNNTGCIRFATTPPLGSVDIERMTILPVGHVGIFNTDPKEALHIGDRMDFHIGTNYDFIGYNDWEESQDVRKYIYDGYAKSMTFDRWNSEIRIGVTKSGTKGNIISYGESNSGFKGIVIGNNDDGLGGIDLGIIGLGTYPATDKRVTIKGLDDTYAKYALNVTNNSGTVLFSVRDDGYIQIGTHSYLDGSSQLTQTLKLSVEGALVTKEILVDITAAYWPDFVFNKDYNLMPLSELEKSINENKKLPGMPSAEEIGKTGINVANMDAKLLQKIEELTLYVIELKKENEALKSKVERLEE